MNSFFKTNMEFHVKMDNLKKNDTLIELEDGFRDIATLKRVMCANTNCSTIGDGPETAQVQKTPYPLDPIIIVNVGQISTSSESSVQSTHTDDHFVTSGDIVCPVLEDIYPHFSLSCMKLDDTTSTTNTRRHDGKSKLSRLLCSLKSKVSGLLCCLTSPTTRISRNSCTCKYDDVTTLHVLRGDEDSDTGVSHGTRKPRRLNGGYKLHAQ